MRQLPVVLSWLWFWSHDKGQSIKHSSFCPVNDRSLQPVQSSSDNSGNQRRPETKQCQQNHKSKKSPFLRFVFRCFCVCFVVVVFSLSEVFRAVASHQKTRRTLVSSWGASWLSAFSSATFYSAVKFSCASSSGGLALGSKSARGASGLCARVSPCVFLAGVYVELSYLLARVSTICHLGTWSSADVSLPSPVSSPTLERTTTNRINSKLQQQQ